MSYYDLQATFRPIDVWPGPPTKDRRSAPFRASWSQTLKLLRRELDALGAERLVIQIDMPESAIRLDGYPRADARARSPGVIIAFEATLLGQALRYPCDSFTTWQDNVRAIALSLEALRKVDRYGVTKRGEQYSGWKALPGAGQSSTTMTAQEAARFIAEHANLEDATTLLEMPLLVQVAFRSAANRLHPDRPGGSHDRMATLSVARTVLEKHHTRNSTSA